MIYLKDGNAVYNNEFYVDRKLQTIRSNDNEVTVVRGVDAPLMPADLIATLDMVMVERGCSRPAAES